MALVPFVVIIFVAAILSSSTALAQVTAQEQYKTYNNYKNHQACGPAGAFSALEGQVFRTVGDDGTAFALSPCGDIAAGEKGGCSGMVVHGAAPKQCTVLGRYDDSNKWAKVADGWQLELQNGEACEPDTPKSAPKVKITLACKPGLLLPVDGTWAATTAAATADRCPSYSLRLASCTACAGGCRVPASDAAPSWSNLTAKQMSNLTSEEMRAATADDVKSIPAAAFAGITSVQMWALTTACAGLQKAQVSSIPAQQFKSVNPLCIRSAPGAAFAALTADQFAAVPTEAIEAFDRERIGTVPPEALSAATAEQVSMFDADAVGGACGALSAAQVAAIPAAAFAGFAGDCVSELGSDAVQDLSVKQVSTMRASALGRMSLATLTALMSLSSDVPSGLARALTGDQLSGFGMGTIMGFKAAVDAGSVPFCVDDVLGLPVDSYTWLQLACAARDERQPPIHDGWYLELPNAAFMGLRRPFVSDIIVGTLGDDRLANLLPDTISELDATQIHELTPALFSSSLGPPWGVRGWPLSFISADAATSVSDDQLIKIGCASTCATPSETGCLLWRAPLLENYPAVDPADGTKHSMRCGVIMGFQDHQWETLMSAIKSNGGANAEKVLEGLNADRSTCGGKPSRGAAKNLDMCNGPAPVNPPAPSGSGPQVPGEQRRNNEITPWTIALIVVGSLCALAILVGALVYVQRHGLSFGGSNSASADAQIDLNADYKQLI